MGLHEGLARQKNDPFDFNKPFGPFVHSRFIERYVRTSNDLSVLGVPNSVSYLAVWSIPEENAFLGPWFEFATVIFWYEGIRLTSENPQFVVIQLILIHNS